MKRCSWRQMGDGPATVEKSYDLAHEVKRATIAVTYWMDMSEKQIPFDLKASVGL